MSAMSDAEAAAWRGRVIQFSTQAAISGADTCLRPDYHSRSVPAESLLATQYHLRPTDLHLEDLKDRRLGLTETTCGGVPP